MYFEKVYLSIILILLGETSPNLKKAHLKMGGLQSFFITDINSLNIVIPQSFQLE